MIRFAWSDGNASLARTVLLVQTGAPDLVGGAIDRIRVSHPEARVTVLLQREMIGRVELRPGVEFLENEGSKAALTQTLRKRRFDAAYVMYSGHPGYWKLKLLPFALGTPHVFAFNELLDSFPISLRYGPSFARHLRWRMRSPSPQRSPEGWAVRVAKTATHPLVIGYLLVWERFAHLRNPRAGAWKRPLDR